MSRASGYKARSAEDRVRGVAETWFITEPLLFGIWTTHRLVMTTEASSLRTGRGRIEMHPAFASLLSDSQLGQVLRLEVLRIALGHPYSRRRPWMAHAWLASNITLAENSASRLPLPRAVDVFGHSDFDHQYFELYYDELSQGRGDHAPGPASLAGPAGGAGAGRDGAGEEPGGAGEEPGGAVEEHIAGNDGTTALWDSDDLVAELLRDAVRSAESSQQWGSVAGMLRHAIVATLAPRLDYRAMLRDFRRSILSSRRYLTRMWPNRRYDFEAMGSRREFSTRLLVAVDVSGSISQREASRALATINQLFRYGIPVVDVVTFDTLVRGPPTHLAKARKTLEIVGGGGTEFQPVLDYLDLERDYDGLIVITDGCAPKPTPPKNRRTRVAWLLSNREGYDHFGPGLRETGRCAFMSDAAPTSQRT